MSYLLPNHNPIKSKIDVENDIWFLSNSEYINVIPLKTFNENGHSIPITLTYDVNTPSFITGINSCLPSGFRLSFNQMVYLDDDKYKYIDEYGIVHQFENFDTNQYYDKDDPNLVLKVLTNEYQIITLNKTYLYFDQYGYLIRIEYAKYVGNTNPLILNILRNTDHSLYRIYYSCNTSDYVQFYYTNSLLTSIKYTSYAQMESIGFIYDNNNNLINIQENETRNIYTFSYSSNRLSQVYDILTADIKQFTYSTYNNVIQMRNVVGKKYNVSATFFSFEVTTVNYDNDGFITSCVIRDKNYKEKTYFLDKYHRLSQCFGSNSIAGAYQALTLHQGSELNFTNTATQVSETINGKNARIVNGSISILNPDSNFVGILNETDLTVSDNPTFILSLYIKINGDYNRVFVRATGTYVHCSYVEIDPSQINCYQQVDIPLTIDSSTSCTLSIEIAQDTSGNNLINGAYFADPIITIGAENRTDIGTTPLANITNVSINGVTYVFPILTKDILLSLFDYHYSTSNKKFIYYNNGQNRLTYTLNDTVLFNHSSGSYTVQSAFTIGINVISNVTVRRHYDNYYSIVGLIKTYRHGTNTLEVGENNHTRVIVSSTITQDRQINKYAHYDQVMNVKSTMEENPSQESSYLYRYYIYNSFNQLIETGSHNDDGDYMMPVHYSYNSDGTLSSCYDDINSVSYGYYRNRVVSIEENCLLTKRAKIYFDIVNDTYYRPEIITFKEKDTSNNTETQLSSHTLTYTDHDEISTISNSGSSYAFDYDDSKTHVKGFIGPLAFGNIYTQSGFDTISESKTWRILNTSKTITTNYDYYSRISTVTFSGGSSYAYSYLLNKESYFVSPLSYITKDSDLYTQLTYFSCSKRLSLVQQYQDNSLFFAKTIYSDQTFEYSYFNQTDKVMTIPFVEYQDNYTGVSSSNTYNGNTFLRCSFVYNYDDFCRRIYKTSQDNTNDNPGKVNVLYEYLSINNIKTNLLSKYTLASGYSLDYTFLQLVDEISYSGSDISSFNETRTVNNSSTYLNDSFEYDVFHRLTRFTRDGWQSYTNNYSYSGGFMSSMVTDLNTTHTFTYNTKGQLTTLLIHPYNSSDYTYTYTYDQLGNRTKEKLNGSTTKEFTYIYNLISTATIGSSTVTMSYDKDLIRYKKVFVDGNLTEETSYAYDGKQLLAIKFTQTTTLMNTPVSIDFYYYFLYDLDGVTGFIYKTGNITEKYCYIKNALGDICYIVKEDGKPVIRYIYDEWGKVTRHILDPNFSTKYELIARVSPFKYRGYVYDYETELYYLLSRYYDPFTHLFTSLDQYSYLNPNNISGVNLYCYCDYNPVMNRDDDGHFATLDLITNGGISFQAAASFIGYLGMAVASIWDEDIREDMNRIGWNPFNADASKVLASSKVSFYKGVPIIRTGFDRSFNFGAIFLDSGRKVWELDHEYGHTFQQLFLGPVDYFLWIMIPSSLQLSVREDYYSRPWESIASLLGGDSENVYSSGCYINSALHLITAKYFGLLSLLFGLW